jgi:hypothetical protein
MSLRGGRAMSSSRFALTGLSQAWSAFGGVTLISRLPSLVSSTCQELG